MEEIEECERKLPGIVKFTANNFKMKIPFKYDKKNLEKCAMIDSLTRLYLTENFHLSDTTRGEVSAMVPEMKNDEPNVADAFIVAYDSIVYGLPVITLNEKHMISMGEAVQKNNRFRSIGILLDNNEFFENNEFRLPNYAKANVRKQTSTTFKVNDINRNFKDVSSILSGGGIQLANNLDERDNSTDW